MKLISRGVKKRPHFVTFLALCAVFLLAAGNLCLINSASEAEVGNDDDSDYKPSYEAIVNKKLENDLWPAIVAFNRVLYNFTSSVKNALVNVKRDNGTKVDGGNALGLRFQERSEKILRILDAFANLWISANFSDTDEPRDVNAPMPQFVERILKPRYKAAWRVPDYWENHLESLVQEHREMTEELDAIHTALRSLFVKSDAGLQKLRTLFQHKIEKTWLEMGAKVQLFWKRSTGRIINKHWDEGSEVRFLKFVSKQHTDWTEELAGIHSAIQALASGKDLEDGVDEILELMLIMKKRVIDGLRWLWW